MLPSQKSFIATAWDSGANSLIALTMRSQIPATWESRVTECGCTSRLSPETAFPGVWQTFLSTMLTLFTPSSSPVASRLIPGIPSTRLGAPGKCTSEIPTATPSASFRIEPPRIHARKCTLTANTCALQQPLKLFQRDAELPQNLEEQWRTYLAAPMNGNRDSSPVGMIPPLMTSCLSCLGKS